MTCHYPALGSASDWMKQIFNQSEALPTFKSSKHHGISALIPQQSFCRETSGGIRKILTVSSSSPRKSDFFFNILV